MVKILFYGACQIGAVRRVLIQYGPPIETELINNYKLIQSDKDFPYEILKNYDFVIYNPLFTRPRWNTEKLVEVCRGIGVRTISFPLPEWRGYFPGIAKGGFGAASTWHYPALFKVAAEYERFEDFEDFIVEEHVPANVLANAENSTAVATRTEEFGEVQVKIAPFIEQNYRHARLFLTTMHPAGALYHEIIRQIAEQTGIRIDPSFYWRTEEVQPGYKDPILPGTSRALGLRFRDSEYQRTNIFKNGRILSLRQYLKLYFYGSREISYYEATTDTVIKGVSGSSVKLSADQLFPVRKHGVVFGLAQDDASRGDTPVLVLESGDHDTLIGRVSYLYMPHWIRRDFFPKAAAERAKLVRTVDEDEVSPVGN